jgi:hypothetical protein
MGSNLEFGQVRLRRARGFSRWPGVVDLTSSVPSAAGIASLVLHGCVTAQPGEERNLEPLHRGGRPRAGREFVHLQRRTGCMARGEGWAPAEAVPGREFELLRHEVESGRDLRECVGRCQVGPDTTDTRGVAVRR